MIVDATKQNPARRIFLLIGIPFITTLLLLASAVTFHVPGISPFLSAHAAAMMNQNGTTCATTPLNQKANMCDGLDPVAQGCVLTARTVQSVGIVDMDGVIIGRIDRRYSPECNSYWARIFDYRSTQPQNTLLALHIGSLTVSGTNTHELYSHMVYAAPGNLTPLIEGSLDANQDGTFDASQPSSATIPQGKLRLSFSREGIHRRKKQAEGKTKRLFRREKFASIGEFLSFLQTLLS